MTQNLVALDMANERRFATAALLREVRSMDREAGQAAVANLLATPEERDQFSSTRLPQLLRSIRQWGDIRVRKLLRAADIKAERRLRDLTDRQALLLAEMVVVESTEWAAMVMPQPRQQIPDEFYVPTVRVAAGWLKTLRPDVQNPAEVARIVLEARPMSDAA